MSYSFLIKSAKTMSIKYFHYCFLLLCKIKYHTYIKYKITYFMTT